MGESCMMKNVFLFFFQSDTLTIYNLLIIKVIFLKILGSFSLLQEK